MRVLHLSRWRSPAIRRFGAWLAALGLVTHALVMAAHVPAGAAAPLPFDTHGLCLASGVVPDGADAPVRSDPHGAPVCKLCQRLQAAATYLPVLAALLVLPTEPSQPAAAGDAPAQPPRFSLTSLNPRGPPPLI